VITNSEVTPCSQDRTRRNILSASSRSNIKQCKKASEASCCLQDLFPLLFNGHEDEGNMLLRNVGWQCCQRLRSYMFSKETSFSTVVQEWLPV
jgi:hypothetical protein